MSLKHIEIINKEGKVLRGYLNIPDNFNGLAVVMYHGFTGNKMETGGIFKTFSRLIAQLGYASIRMDFSGNGESDGDFSQMTFDTLIEESVAILDYIKRMPGVKKVVVLGFSMGGAIASILSTIQGEDIDGLLLWSPAGNITEIVIKAYENSPKLTNKAADFGGWEISLNLVRSAKRLTLYEGLEDFEAPCLVIHGSNDLSVNYKWGEKFANEYPNGKFILINGAPHGYNSQAFRQKLFEESIEFIKKI